MTSRGLGGGARRWTPAIVAGTALIVVVGATLASGNSDTPAPAAADSNTTVVDTVLEGTGTVPGDVATVPGYTTTTLPFVPLDKSIGSGNTGPAVKALQQRLVDLHFDPGPVDGTFGSATKSAVWAYEKLIVGTDPSKVTGRVTPAMWEAMNHTVEVVPRRPSGTTTHLEVYLPQQVAVLFKNGEPELITHISTGSNQVWTAKETIDPGTEENPGTTPITKVVTGTSITPGGIYTFYRKDWGPDGWRTGSLGRMYKPVYFNFGVAVHGANEVPNHPASHGCVRIPMHIAEYFPDLVHKGDQVFVFDGVKEPEQYGRQPPPFDQDITPSTTTSTTTAPATTPKTTPAPAATTTQPKSTTTGPPSATTTTAAPATTKAAATTVASTLP